MKTYKYLFITLSSVLSLSPIVHADWIGEYDTCDLGNATIITADTTIPKIEGKYTYCAKEIKPWNPFLTHTITTCSGNGCAAGYYVDGYPFVSGHALWEYRDGSGNPQQLQYMQVADKKTYYYDKTAPICGTTSLTDSSGNPYGGGWSNVDIYSSTSCEDPLSGCDASKNTGATGRKILSHLATETPSLTFHDNVDNVAVLHCGLGGISKVLIDDRSPEITRVLFKSKNIVSDEAFSQKAGGLTLDITVKDEKSASYGVSGIQSIDGKIFTTHTAPTTRTRRVCSGYWWFYSCHDETYTEVITSTTVLCEVHYTASSQYNIGGTGVLPDIQSIHLQCSDSSGIQTAGTSILDISVKDFAGNTVSQQKTLTVYPSDTVTFTKTLTAISPNPPFANDNDAYLYTVRVADKYNNPVIGKEISGIHIPEAYDIDLDNSKPTTGSAIDIVSASFVTNNNGEINYSVKSYTPGTWKEYFEFSFPKWDDNNADISTETRYIGTKTPYSFFAPFKGEMTMTDENENPVSYFIFGQKQLAILAVERASDHIGIIPEKINNYADGSTGPVLSNWLQNDGNTKYNITKGQTISTEIDSSNGSAIQKTTFVAEQTDDVSNTYVGKLVALPTIQYMLNGKEISYRLSKTFTGQVSSVIACTNPLGCTNTVCTNPLGCSPAPACTNPAGCDPVTPTCTNPAGCDTVVVESGSINPIYIEGLKYTTGKEGIRSNQVNIGAMNLADLGNLLKKNWALETRNRTLTSGNLFNGIKYINGDTTLGSIAIDGSWKTLVVVDGNITIDNDFNTSKESLAIVLLKSSPSNSKGNIYIKPNVNFIGATIYADGSIESVDASGNIFTTSDTVRGNALKNQIVFYGGLYTRNTIGGATAGKDYILPGGSITQNLNLAVQYDLSYLRMGNTGWNAPPLNGWNAGHEDAVIILKDARAANGNLPLFQIN